MVPCSSSYPSFTVICFYIQTLTNEFRLNYSHLWLSILKGDKDGMKRHSEALNCGDLYGLLSCMVAGRAWSSIEGGKLESGKVNPFEVRVSK